MYIDSHAHIFYEDFKEDLHDVLKRAQDAGVESIVVPGTTLETSKEAIQLAERYDFIYACVGCHPHEASKATDQLLAEIEELSRNTKVVAIGEIGLDFHYDFSPRGKQIAAFTKQTHIAVKRNLPIVVHTRESIPESVAIIEDIVKANPKWRAVENDPKDGMPACRGVFHCFTGDAQQAQRLFELGFLVSYPGIVTFKNSPVLETLKSIGCDRILVETDSPYMTPVPLRGKRNEPANVVYVANKIAEVLNLSLAEVARRTSHNTKMLFGMS